MIPHTCRSCGHVYGEDNAFVLQSRCCPRCGQKLNLKQRKWRPYPRIAVAVLIGVIIVLIFSFTSELLNI